MRLSVIAEVLRDDSGATAIEYGLTVAVISTALVLSLSSLGDALSSIFEHVTEVLKKAAG